MKNIYFYRTDDAYGCFSNFSKHPTIISGSYWVTVEHYFQAQKFLDEEIVMEIIQAKTPMEAARRGRDKSKPLRKDWEQVKVDIMRKGVEAKVLQHEDVRDLLLSTGDATIIEHTANDNFWGDGGDGQGKNMLGIILMSIRDQLREHQSLALEKLLPPPWDKFPDECPTSLFWAMGKGESYLGEWVVWFRTLSKEQKSKYISTNKAPKEWSNFYNQS